jgi:hypothetical protein
MKAEKSLFILRLFFCDPSAELVSNHLASSGVVTRNKDEIKVLVINYLPSTQKQPLIYRRLFIYHLHQQICFLNAPSRLVSATPSR